MRNSAINQIDFYKTGHIQQYPTNTEYVYSNFTARSNSKSNIENSKGVVFIGLQLFIKDYLIDEWNNTFFAMDKSFVVDKYQRQISNALGYTVDVSHIADLHDLGYLPIHIKALPEGSFVPYKIPLLTIVNTLPEFYWLPNYLESVISNELWPMTTSATTYFEYLKTFHLYADLTGADKNFIPFQAHDFSFRGMFGRDAAAKSAFAAIACGSMGTDSLPGIDIAEIYYNATEDFIAGSVNATEHSVMSSNIELLIDDITDRSQAEFDTFKRLIVDVYPTGNISIVSDTFDFWNVVSNILPGLKSIIMERDGKVIIRPDSGDPVDILCGKWNHMFHDFDMNGCILNNIEECLCKMQNMMLSWNTTCHPDDIQDIFAYFKFKNKYYKVDILCEWKIFAANDCRKSDIARLDNFKLTHRAITPTPQQLGLIESLWNIFGGKVNDKGFKTLDSHIGAIYGDSITLDRQKQILHGLKLKGFASDNVVLGVGSFSYQYITRDTHGFAMKATSIVVDGKRYDIFKDPKTDSGTKKSARGLLMVSHINGKYELKDQCTEREEKHGCLETVYLDGRIAREHTLKDIRDRTKLYL